MPAEADVYQAIADPTRRQILDLLAGAELPVNDLAAPFAMSRPAISQHLRVLREAGLVTDRKAGRQRLYRLQRSEEHTSELQSPDHLVCRLLLEKKKKNIIKMKIRTTK